VLPGDREFLARVARLNAALVACALPLANHTLTSDQLRTLGDELHAVGQEFRARSDPTRIYTPVGVVDGVVVTTVENPHRTVAAVNRHGTEPRFVCAQPRWLEGGKE
jgi:hypothetical protein